MEKLRSLILRLSNAERVGGRVQIIDSQTVVLYDCMYWASFNTDVILAHYPETKIHVKACRHSLSGFQVTFTVPRGSHREVFWYFVIGVVLACCAYLLRPSWAADKFIQHI
jgi:hypothetical protein